MNPGDFKQKKNPLLYFVLHVESPKIVYNGQKLIRLVARKTPPSTSRTVPSVPLTVPVKYNAANTMANKMRTILSVDPMFFFMMYEFWVNTFMDEGMKTLNELDRYNLKK